jgi:iron-sulfur cluster assembly accessory protein
MITITPKAIAEINRMKAMRELPHGKLRLGVAKGGCQQLYYTLDVINEITSGDRLYVIDQLEVVVPINHLTYLHNLKVDYAEDLMGGSFRFQNPNVQKVCGCGNSFTPVDEINIQNFAFEI